MRELIEKLVELQDVLKQIYEYEKTNKTLPRNVKKLRDEFEPQKSLLAGDREDLAGLQREQSDDESALQMNMDRLAGIEDRRQNVKTQKEYEAVAEEQLGLEQQVAALKTTIAERAERIEQMQSGIDERAAAIAEEEQKISDEEEKVSGKISENDAKIEELNSRKDQMAKDLDQKVLKRFERVLKRKNGVAIVPVIDGSCQGCHMNLPPQLITEVMRQDSLVNCLNCSRYLYIPETL